MYKPTVQVSRNIPGMHQMDVCHKQTLTAWNPASDQNTVGDVCRSAQRLMITGPVFMKETWLFLKLSLSRDWVWIVQWEDKHLPYFYLELNPCWWNMSLPEFALAPVWIQPWMNEDIFYLGRHLMFKFPKEHLHYGLFFSSGNCFFFFMSLRIWITLRVCCCRNSSIWCIKTCAVSEHRHSDGQMSSRMYYEVCGSFLS